LANKAKDVKEEVDELSSSNGKSIKDLKHEINELFDRLADDEKDIKDLNDKVQDSVKVEIETLVSQVQDKLEDVDNKCQENEGHVTNLREVNRIALERIKENVQDDIEAHKELIEENKDLLDKSGKAINDLEAKIEELEKELGDLKSDEIDDLAKEQKEMKDKIEALDEQGKVLDEKLQNENNQMALMVQQIRVSQENTVREMRQEIIKVVPEDIDIQMLKETIDSLNDKYENATKQREEMIVNIQNVDERYARGIEDMEERHGTEAKSATLRMESLEKTLVNNYDDMWNVVLPIYGTLRGYTVCLYSDKMASEAQPLCLGLYRSVDYKNGRPVYKQEEGQNFLFFFNNAWFIGPHVGNHYTASIRSKIESDSSSSSSESSSSSSSSSTSSSSDESDHSMGSSSSKKAKKTTKKVKKFDMLGEEIRTPDQVTLGWQYRLKICLDNDNCWAEDETLRVEALRGTKTCSKTVIDLTNRNIWHILSSKVQPSKYSLFCQN